MRTRLRWIDIRPGAAFELCRASEGALAVLAWVFFVERYTPHCLHGGSFGRAPS